MCVHVGLLMTRNKLLIKRLSVSMYPVYWARPQLAHMHRYILWFIYWYWRYAVCMYIISGFTSQTGKNNNKSNIYIYIYIHTHTYISTYILTKCTSSLFCTSVEHFFFELNKTNQSYLSSQVWSYIHQKKRWTPELTQFQLTHTA